ncbi:myosin-like protein [Rhynchospora pubera]|uniref:Myosin-like protein n=1 Tax=Rhynchospora pubera TaxID=906938 RepID=A0AAV8DLA9_9POAL|nr:myosin-like protein [Rhynchospora pubera]
MATRRGKWHQPPAQTPRILNLPRRSRSTRTSRAKPDRNLISLFDLEKRVRAESAPVSPPGHRDKDSGEEKWRFQAEMLRAECNFLRMEREVAVRKLDRHRNQMETALRSAVDTLVSGRKKIDGTGLDEEIQDLEDILEDLQVEKEGGRQSFRQLQRCRGRNFDRQASTLRRRLERMPVSEEVSVKEIREITLPVLHRKENAPPDDEVDRVVTETDDLDEKAHKPDVEVLKKKMEGLSKGMLERMVEYGFMPRWRQEQQMEVEEHAKTGAESSSRCECREIVGKIMEQVKVESEQWTEMQAMLEQVRQEMLELQSSRDLWQRRAIASDINVRSLHAQVLEWKHRARVSENNVEGLKERVSELQNKLQSMKIEHLGQKNCQEDFQTSRPNMKLNSQRQIVLPDHKREDDKYDLVCRLKKPPSQKLRRIPFTEIGNFSKQ